MDNKLIIGGQKMEKEKVCFKDLSLWLKILMIYSSVSLIGTIFMLILTLFG